MKATSAIVGVFCLFTTVLANGEFSILHSPNGINFRGEERLNASELPKIISTAIGHPTYTSDLWNGLIILNPFNYPKAAVVVSVEGVSSLQLNEPRYPLQTTAQGLDEVKDDFISILGHVLLDENDLYTGVHHKVYQFLKLDAKDVSVKEFLKDLDVLRDLKHKVSSKSILSNVWVRLNGLESIVREYGLESEQIIEATTVLKSALNELEDALEVKYGDRFLLTVLTNDRRHLRQKREEPTTAPKETTEAERLNLSKQYGSDYAAIFNIILWISVFLIAALISTAVFICTLDPGRDSIIYRMTTQRIKKEN